MSGKERRGGGAFGRHGRSYQTWRQRIAQALGFTGMTAVEVLGSVDELTDGAGGSVGSVTEAKSGPYRKSRFMSSTLYAPPITYLQKYMVEGLTAGSVKG